jgi:hypothetical protein
VKESLDSLLGGMLPPLGPAPHLLLVETVNADQFPGQTQLDYAHVHGACNLAGAPCVHLRYGIRTDNQAVHGRDEITLDDAELTALLDCAARLKPTMAIFSHAIVPEQEARLVAAHPGLQVLRGQSVGLDTVTALLDRPDCQPDYGWVAGNDRAASPAARHIYVANRAGCCHKLDAGANPYFVDVPWNDEVRRYGCSFCLSASAPSARRMVNDADLDENPDERMVDRLRKQFQAMARTATGDRRPRGVLFDAIVGNPPLPVIKRLADEAGLDGVSMLFATRPDYLLRMAPRVEAFLESVAGSAFHMGFYVVGVESFNADDLKRFNKGTTPEQNEGAIRFIQSMEARYPRNFSCGEYLPYCLILFTPWSTFGHVRHNLEVIRTLGIQKNVGNLFRSRLRLHPNTALVLLAQRDGLLLPEARDALDRLNRFKLFPSELAWRFQDERVEFVAQLSQRLQDSDAFGADSLNAELRAFLLDAFYTPTPDQVVLIDLLYHVVSALEQGFPPAPVRTLLAEGLRRWREVDGAAALDAGDGPNRTGEQRPGAGHLAVRFRDLPGQHDYLFFLARKPEGREFLAANDTTAVFHRDARQDASMRALCKLMSASLKVGNRTPGAESLYYWRALVQALLRKAGLEGRFSVDVRLVAPWE